MAPDPPADIDGLSLAALKALVVQLLSKVAEQEQLIADLREENAQLKGLNGRPRIKPSGMENTGEASVASSGVAGRKLSLNQSISEKGSMFGPRDVILAGAMHCLAGAMQRHSAHLTTHTAPPKSSRVAVH